jgi:hypothetical protein
MPVVDLSARDGYKRILIIGVLDGRLVFAGE